MAVSAPKRWTIQEIFTQTYKNVANTQVYATVDDLKSCNVENNQETVYSMGGVGNAYITAHSHSKRCTGSASAATYKNAIMGLVTGTDPVTGTATVPVNGEIITVNSDASATKYTAVGTAGSEIIGLFVHNEDGSLGEELTQVAIAPTTDTTFQYTSGTKALDFNASAFDDGTQLIIFYEATADASSHTITNDTETFSKIVRIEMDTLVQDACSGDEYAATMIIYKAKLQGNISMDLAADGNPAELSVDFEALKASCTNSKLWDLIVIGEKS